jgi:mannose-1-phosphate guanylyltransferase
MKALVLAAGKGSRLGEVAGGVPKPLVPVGRTTPLDHNLQWIAPLASHGIWINLHTHGEAIRRHVGDEVAGVPISYSWEPELLGTAGAWKRLEAEWSDTSFVIYGDNFMRFDLAALLAAHRRGGAPATIAIFDPSVHANTGIGGGRVRVSSGRITEFVEGAATGIVNAGAYCLEPVLAERLPDGFSDFGRDIMPELARDGVLAAHLVEAEGYCLGIDSPELLQAARRMLDERVVAP